MGETYCFIGACFSDKLPDLVDREEFSHNTRHERSAEVGLTTLTDALGKNGAIGNTEIEGDMSPTHDFGMRPYIGSSIQNDLLRAIENDPWNLVCPIQNDLLRSTQNNPNDCINTSVSRANGRSDSKRYGFWVVLNRTQKVF